MSSTPPMTQRYPGLSTIQDPATRQVLKNLFDMMGGVQVHTQAIGTVSAPLVAPLQGNKQQIKSLADPTEPQDAVTLKYLHTYVESRVQTAVNAAVATIPGSPTGPPVVPSGPLPGTIPPTGALGSGSLTRGFDLSQATVFNSPTDIASWPVTGAISSVTFTPGLGVYCACPTVSVPYSMPPPLPGQWPQDPNAAPDAAGIQYTLWAVLEVSGVYYTSGFIQFWIGRPGSGGVWPEGAGFSTDWAYDTRWGPMNGQMPPIGSQLGFFLSAGNARGITSVTTVRERSDVVFLALPDLNGAIFT